MARAKTMDELLQEAEEGKSGGTLGENYAKTHQQVETPEDKKKKKKRGFFQGRRDLRTILSGGGDDE